MQEKYRESWHNYLLLNAFNYAPQDAQYHELSPCRRNSCSRLTGSPVLVNVGDTITYLDTQTGRTQNFTFDDDAASALKGGHFEITNRNSQEDTVTAGR